MSRPPGLPLRLSAWLALFVGVVGCGVVYTGEEPRWYVACQGAEQDCSCTYDYDYGYDVTALTQSPEVTECSAEKAGGVCCGDADTDCTCKAVRCVNNGLSCQCAFWPKITGELRDCGAPTAGQFCCMEAATAVCTCATQNCGTGTTPVPSCSPQYFTCALLGGSDSAPFTSVDQAYSTCSGSGSGGVVTYDDPCPEAYSCGE
jgi:hypothetical protein